MLEEKERKESGLASAFFLEFYDRVRVRDNRERSPVWRRGTLTKSFDLHEGGIGFVIAIDNMAEPIRTDGVNFTVEKYKPRPPRKPKVDHVNLWSY